LRGAERSIVPTDTSISKDNQNQKRTISEESLERHTDEECPTDGADPVGSAVKKSTGGRDQAAAGVPNKAEQQREMFRDMPDGRIMLNPVSARNGSDKVVDEL